jgi:CTP:molybdopterin cytidylyltransferase MocA
LACAGKQYLFASVTQVLSVRARINVMPTTPLIVAAGRGLRAGGEVPKQCRLLNGPPILAWTLDAFLRHENANRVLAVVHPADDRLYEGVVRALLQAERANLAAPVWAGTPGSNRFSGASRRPRQAPRRSCWCMTGLGP